MRIFKEVDIPETCYVLEIVYWLALGRVPEFFFTEGVEDYRKAHEAEFEGSICDFDFGFSASEFAAFGIHIDMDRYQKARLTSGTRTGQQHLRHEEDNLKRVQLALSELKGSGFDLENPNIGKVTEERDRLFSEAKEADWARMVEMPMYPVIDKAIATVFQALTDGSLSAVGVVPHTDDNSDSGKFVSIPSTAWSLRYFNWDESRLMTPNATFDAVQVETKKVFDIFPKPNVSPTRLIFDSYGDALIISADNEETPSKRKRPGRPEKVDRSVVANYFADLIKTGKAPHKIEALLEEVIHFVAVAFGVRITRSTAQSYIGRMLEANGRTQS